MFLAYIYEIYIYQLNTLLRRLLLLLGALLHELRRYIGINLGLIEEQLHDFLRLELITLEYTSRVHSRLHILLLLRT